MPGAGEPPPLTKPGSHWSGVKHIVKHEGAEGLLTRRGDTLSSALRRCITLALITSAYVFAGGAVFSALEREAELERLREFDVWGETVTTLSDADVITGPYAAVMGSMLTAANPDPSVRAEASRQEAAAVAEFGLAAALATATGQASPVPPRVVSAGGSATLTPVVVTEGASVALFATANVTSAVPRLKSIRMQIHYRDAAGGSITASTLPAVTRDTLTVGGKTSAVVTVLSGLYPFTVAYDASTAVLLATAQAAGGAPRAHVQAVLQQVAFASGEHPAGSGVAARLVNVSVVDMGGLRSADLSLGVVVSPVNDPPRVGWPGGGPAATVGGFVENSPANVTVGALLEVADDDSASLASARVTVRGGPSGTSVVPKDRLWVPAGTAAANGVKVVYDTANNTLIVTPSSAGAAVGVAQWQAALRAVEFGTAAGIDHTAHSKTRTIAWSVTDAAGLAATAVATRSVSISLCDTACAATEWQSSGCVPSAPPVSATPRVCSPCTPCATMAATLVRPCTYLVDAQCLAAPPVVFYDATQASPVLYAAAVTTNASIVVANASLGVPFCDVSRMAPGALLYSGGGGATLRVSPGSNLTVLSCGPTDAFLSSAVNVSVVVDAAAVAAVAGGARVFGAFSVSGLLVSTVGPLQRIRIIESIAAAAGLTPTDVNIVLLTNSAGSPSRRRLDVGEAVSVSGEAVDARDVNGDSFGDYGPGVSGARVLAGVSTDVFYELRAAASASTGAVEALGYAVGNATVDGTLFTALVQKGVVQIGSGSLSQLLLPCQRGWWNVSAGYACTPLTPACAVGTYESAAPTAFADRSCAPCNAACADGCIGPTSRQCANCTTGYWHSAAANGDCLAVTTCSSSQYTAQAATKTTDTVCPSCSSACNTCVAAGADNCGPVSGQSYKDCKFSGFWFDSSGGTGSCVALTTCARGEYQKNAPTATSDRVCVACHSSCYECAAAGANSCTRCSSGKWLNGNQCDDCSTITCSAGQYVQTCGGGSDSTCKSCDAACQTCTGAGASACTQCASTHTRLGSTCYPSGMGAACASGWSLNPAADRCVTVVNGGAAVEAGAGAATCAASAQQPGGEYGTSRQASVRDAAENEFVRGLVAGAGLTRSSSTIGLSFSTSSQSYAWSDGTPYGSYSGWSGSPPGVTGKAIVEVAGASGGAWSTVDATASGGGHTCYGCAPGRYAATAGTCEACHVSCMWCTSSNTNADCRHSTASSSSEFACAPGYVAGSAGTCVLAASSSACPSAPAGWTLSKVDNACLYVGTSSVAQGSVATTCGSAVPGTLPAAITRSEENAAVVSALNGAAAWLGVDADNPVWTWGDGSTYEAGQAKEFSQWPTTSSDAAAGGSAKLCAFQVATGTALTNERCGAQRRAVCEVSPTDGTCPGSFSLVKSGEWQSCYAYSSSFLEYKDHVAHCTNQAANSYIALAKTSAGADAVDSTCQTGYNCFVGLRAMPKWASTGAALVVDGEATKVPWGTDEPALHGTCVQLASSGKWASSDCSGTAMPICRLDIPTVTSTQATAANVGATSLVVTGTGFSTGVVARLSTSAGVVPAAPSAITVDSATQLTLTVPPLPASTAGATISAVVFSGDTYSGGPVPIATVHGSSAGRLLPEAAAHDVLRLALAAPEPSLPTVNAQVVHVGPRHLVAVDTSKNISCVFNKTAPSGGSEGDGEGGTSLPYWNWSGAMFFSFTVITSIGYGSYAPTRSESHAFLLVYGFFGIGSAAYMLDTIGRLVLVIATIVVQRLRGGALTAEDEVRILVTLAVIILGLGATVFTWLQEGTVDAEWTWFESLYFCVVSLTTVGLGDYTPTTTNSRMFCGFFVFVGLGIMSSLISAVAAVISGKGVTIARKGAVAGEQTMAKAKQSAYNLKELAGESERTATSRCAGCCKRSKERVVHGGKYDAAAAKGDGGGEGDSNLDVLGSKAMASQFDVTGLPMAGAGDGSGSSSRAAAARGMRKAPPMQLKITPAGAQRLGGEAKRQPVQQVPSGFKARHKGAENRWAMVAAQAMSKVASRRGDTLRSLLGRTVCVSLVWLGLLLLGAAVFSSLEREPEEFREAKYESWSEVVCDIQMQPEVSGAAANNLGGMLQAADPNPARRAALERERLRAALEAAAASGAADLPVVAPPGDNEQWTLLGGSFFAITLVTTVGYGSYSVSTTGGQVFVIVYSLVGIGIVGAALDAVSRTILVGLTTAAHHMSGGRCRRRHLNHSGRVGAEQRGSSGLSQRAESWVSAALVALFLLVGGALFVVLQSSEEVAWSFFEAVYFTFVTISTIGLGDYVPTSRVGLVVLGFFMFLALGLFAFVINVVSGHYEAFNEALVKRTERCLARGRDAARRASVEARGIAAAAAANARGDHVGQVDNSAAVSMEGHLQPAKKKRRPRRGSGGGEGPGHTTIVFAQPRRTQVGSGAKQVARHTPLRPRTGTGGSGTPTSKGGGTPKSKAGAKASSKEGKAKANTRGGGPGARDRTASVESRDRAPSFASGTSGVGGGRLPPLAPSNAWAEPAAGGARDAGDAASETSHGANLVSPISADGKLSEAGRGIAPPTHAAGALPAIGRRGASSSK